MKYWAYVNNEILGPFEKGKLLELPSFSPSLLVCPQTPVGEKTEDWKEASTYPELSALIGQGSMSHTPAAAADVPTVAPESFAPPAAAPAPEPQAKPLESHSMSFKPLTASKSIDPVPPAEHAPAGINIASNRLGKAGGEHTQAAQSQQSSSAFDPISLSRIERRSESLSGQNQPAPEAAEGIALEPPRAFPSPDNSNKEEPFRSVPLGAERNPQPAEQLPPVIPISEPAPISFAPAAGPAPSPVIETFSRPAAAGPAPVTDMAGLESLVQRLDALSKNSATRQDINSAVDPLRMKLDQMGEVISSIKNSQFQREVMDKLVYLENAVGELKTAFRSPQQAPAQAMPQKMEMEKNSDTVFGVQPVKQAEKPKAEPAKEAAKPAEVADTGSKPSRLVPVLKKIARLVITLVLLAAVAVGAVIFLKNFGIFDATKFIPFPIPFISAPKAQPQQSEAEAQKAALAAMEELTKEASPEQQAQQAQQPGEQELQPTTPEEQEALRKTMQLKAMQEQSQKKPMQADIAPEIIYIARTYKLKPGGPSLENKIYEHAGNAGGNFNRTSWDVKPGADGLFDIAAVIPAKTNSLNYTFVVDRAKKSVSPVNDAGKAAFEAMAKESEAKPPKKSSKKAAAKPAPKPQAKKAAPKQAAPEEEYEYEYVEDDGTEQ